MTWPKALKAVAFVTCLVPAGMLLYAAFVSGDLGINPIETLTTETGKWGLRLLLASLAITPLRRLTGWNRIVTYRRMLGLFAFFYAVVHLSIWVIFDHYFNWRAMLDDIVERPFITAGTVALLCMVPLALTSTRGWIRRMGRRWQQLHRLVYLGGAAAVVHFIWKEKVKTDETLIYAGVFVLLMLLRIGFAVRKRMTAAPARL